jgi:hypothetical protein
MFYSYMFWSLWKVIMRQQKEILEEGLFMHKALEEKLMGYM